MRFKKPITDYVDALSCDFSPQAETCHVEITEDLDHPAKSLLAHARSKGWLRVDGTDICPACAEKRKKG